MTVMAISVWVLTAYRRVDIALPLPLVSIGGRLSRVWPAKLLPPLSLSLSTSLTFNQMDY